MIYQIYNMGRWLDVNEILYWRSFTSKRRVLSRSLWVYHQIQSNQGGFPPVRGIEVMWKDSETGYQYHWFNLKTYLNWKSRMERSKSDE